MRSYKKVNFSISTNAWCDFEWELQIYVVTDIKKIIRQICAGACVNKMRKHQFLRKQGGIEIYWRFPNKSFADLYRHNGLNWRVWSWLRLNAGCMLNTCKSNEKVPSGASTVADGWVMHRNLPSSGGQLGETRANTAYFPREKDFGRYWMSLCQISLLVG